MLARLSEQQKAINLYVVERGGIDNLSQEEWKLIECVINVLKPFYDATLEICFDDACISIVIPIIAMLKNKLELQAADEDENQCIVQMKVALQQAMAQRFASVKKATHVLAATLLDPRFKDMYFNDLEKKEAMSEILKFLTPNVVDDREKTGVNVNVPGENNKHTGDTGGGGQYDNDEHENLQSTSSLWHSHDSVKQNDAPTLPTDIPDCERQLERYMCAPRVNRMTNIFAFWNCSNFPSLEPAARKYLSAPPTNVASEQLFSAAGQIYADRRSNLHGENVEKLLFLAYNIKLLGFSY